MFFEDVLRDFFGIGTHSRKELTEKVAHAATGLDFEMAIAAHENWMLRLQAFLEGTSTEVFASEQICFDDRCDLGKWIYSTGRAKLGSFPGFTALQGHHKMFHYAASNVVALAQAAKPMKPTKCWKCSLPSTRRKWCVTCNISAPWCARPGKAAPTPATEPLAPRAFTLALLAPVGSAPRAGLARRRAALAQSPESQNRVPPKSASAVRALRGCWVPR